MFGALKIVLLVLLAETVDLAIQQARFAEVFWWCEDCGEIISGFAGVRSSTAEEVAGACPKLNKNEAILEQLVILSGPLCFTMFYRTRVLFGPYEPPSRKQNNETPRVRVVPVVDSWSLSRICTSGKALRVDIALKWCIFRELFD